MTPFMLAMNFTCFVALTVGWLKGGHPERFGIAVLLSYELLEGLYREWRIGDSELSQALLSALAHERAAGRVALALIFVWLAFRSPRWWPLAATAALVLIVLVHLMQIMTLIPFNGAASARVGLWMLLYTVVLAGTLERWLAGEAPVSRIGRDRSGKAL